MAYRECSLGVMVKEKPQEASKRIMSAYQKNKGNTTKTAEYLGVDRATLKRWVNALDLRDELIELRCNLAA